VTGEAKRAMTLRSSRAKQLPESTSTTNRHRSRWTLMRPPSFFTHSIELAPLTLIT
jgi:hypothetical protein